MNRFDAPQCERELQGAADGDATVLSSCRHGITNDFDAGTPYCLFIIMTIFQRYQSFFSAAYAISMVFRPYPFCKK